MTKEEKIKLVKANSKMKNQELADLLSCSVSQINELRRLAGVAKPKVTRKDAAQKKKEILSLLKKADRTTKFFADRFAMAESGVNRHLYELRRLGAITYEKDSRGISKWTYIGEPVEPVTIHMHSLPMNRLPDYFGHKKTGHIDR